VATSRIVVVTGGASGIGRAAAQRFGADGDQVIVADRNEAGAAAIADSIVEAGGKARAIAIDVADEKSVGRAAEDVTATDGPPDVLVNSAGLLQDPVTSQALDMAEHDAIWQVNYRGTYVCCRAFGRIMADRGTGAIVNLASVNSYSVLPLPAYTPGKAAIKSLTELLAVEYGAHGVRVNAVAPGYTLTENLAARVEAGQRDARAMRTSTALNQMVMPEDVAGAIAFLCSSDALRITGVTLPIDAGWLPAVSYQSYATPVRTTARPT